MRFDQLALLGKPMEHEDQVESVLEGLPKEYKTIVDQIESRDTAPTLTEIHEKLLNHELKLSALTSSTFTLTPVSAHVAQTRYNNSNKRSTSSNNNNNSYYRRSQPTSSTYPPRADHQHQSRGYQGRCQICSVYGHNARTCSQLQLHQLQRDLLSVDSKQHGLATTSKHGHHGS